MTSRQDIADLFAEAQGSGGEPDASELARAGMHIIAPRMSRKGVLKTPERLQAMRAYMRRRRREEIKVRVLSGEQPRYRAALAVWYQVADEFGVDTSGWRLPRPVTPDA